MELALPRSLLVLASIAAAPGVLTQAQMGTTWRVSVSSTGEEANGPSSLKILGLSSDGRVVTFTAGASNLVPGDTNGLADIFVHDRRSGRTERVSVSSAGEEANGQSRFPSVSADGRYVAFGSFASNLVPGDTNGYADIFLHDRSTGKTTRVSMNSAGAEADGPSVVSQVSATGRWVAFDSYARNLARVNPNSYPIQNAFVHDTQTGKTVCVSVTPAGTPSAGIEPRITPDGRYVTFAGLYDNLVPGDGNSAMDVFVRDMHVGVTTLVSVDSTGLSKYLDSYYSAISDDGRLVAFYSLAALVPGDVNSMGDIYVHDRTTGRTTLVSVDSAGGSGNDSSAWPWISGDGRWVCFASQATNLVPGDTNGHVDVFSHDLATGTIERLSVDSMSTQGDGFSAAPFCSLDGRTIAFASSASNLVPGDGNATHDVFVRERLGCTPTIATYCTASTTSIPGCSASISSSGKPSLTDPGSFTIHSGNIPGAGLGIAYWGVLGPAALPLGSQGGWLCVEGPTSPSNGKDSAGTAGLCDGELAFSLQDLMTSHPVAVGSTVHAAIWFRDGASPDSFGLSNGIWFQICH